MSFTMAGMPVSRQNLSGLPGILPRTPHKPAMQTFESEQIKGDKA
jgi:hypothetical protein